MSEKHHKKRRPAVIFGQKCVKNVGYIDEYIFACEIVGGDHITYPKPRRPKYHLVIIILEGRLRMIINGDKHTFKKNTYVNLPTWADIYEIEYDESFHAMVTATDKTVIEDIFRNRNPFPPDFRMQLNHGYGGSIFSERDVNILCSDISNLINALQNKSHFFAEEISYSYFYIMLTDMADMMWRRYGKEVPSRHPDMRRADNIIKDFVKLLQENIETHTDVGFYAEKLYISKQYLSLIVKEKTMVPIGTIISTLRAEVAAGLLRDPDMSIQQIAHRLSFSDQSSFGKFFKKHSGLSPLKYRQGLRKTLLTMRQKQ